MTRKVSCKRNQRGGGLGGGYGFDGKAAESYLHTVNNGMAWDSISQCRAPASPTDRPGFMPGAYERLSAHGGLPGMNGGARKRKGRRASKKGRKGRKGRRVSGTSKTMRLRKQANRRFTQKGGRYGFEGNTIPEIGGTPWGTSYPPVAHVPCEASRTPIPPDHASNTLNRVGGYLWDGKDGLLQRGGAGTPVGEPVMPPTGPDTVGLTVPTARYTVNPPGFEPIRSAAGTNIELRLPQDWTQMNPACLKTGGARKVRKASRKEKKSRRTSVARKANREGRKGSRKN